MLKTDQDSSILKIIDAENQNGVDPSTHQNGDADEGKDLDQSQSNIVEGQIDSTQDSSQNQEKAMTS